MKKVSCTREFDLNCKKAVRLIKEKYQPDKIASIIRECENNAWDDCSVCRNNKLCKKINSLLIGKIPVSGKLCGHFYLLDINNY